MGGTNENQENKVDVESTVKRNPHPDFKTVESSRPLWSEATFKYTRTPNPDWKVGQGANDGGEGLKKGHVEIDPYEPGRPAVFNYKLLISAIVPRPIGFCSTVSKDGTSPNLAPFSFFNVINHDPPLFVFGFSGGFDRAKDSCRNLVDTGECCINIISEHYIEAANFTSINTPHGISEWGVAGLHPAPCSEVKPSRVKEAIFSIEAKLVETKEFESRSMPGKKSGVLAIVEGIRFHARQDAINEDKNMIDPAILRPMGRLGGIGYSRVTEGIELPRPDFTEVSKNGNAGEFIKPKA
ncbi:hypothetical protein P152DRAFT_459258 [Eremomyces bilateralis CBS 781.70]|uniref:Flavin reductase like domain-containing protein n=1 Tax=Eremomyces bilateralis CBS 781.70 TaxID=1392243 RepID=A0A6G1G1D5_9PEZI|nr:uncharacterized protein P152DRAFT_459258 [Eremomyces bilateralis CBS 781.70]KAF1811792.1 hypothetical protein P152DRAFT_459258 [Eremomyces bilateralis CBS 781.70]